MSDQPITGVPPAQSAAPVQVPGKGGIWLGVLLMVLGLVGAVTTYFVQQASYSRSVENLVRALPGYRTELLFEKTGTFTFYYEYAGTFETTLDGEQRTITLDAPATPPPIDTRLFDQNGDEVRLVSGVGDITYDVSGFEGVAMSQADIEREGSYTLEVVSDSDATFAVAAGKGTIEEPSAVLPAIIAAVGLLLGLLVIVVSANRRSRARRAAQQAAAIPSVPGPAYPPSGAAVGARPTDAIWAQTAPGQATPAPTWATSPPPPAAPAPPVAPPSAPPPPPATWAAPGAPDGAPPRPDVPTVQTPVTTPMPVQAPPAAPAPAPPSFPPPGAAAPPEAPADDDENPPARSPWGAPTPPSS
jgi:hypothetical protein